jgi:opacity protein-like surface antigen
MNAIGAFMLTVAGLMVATQAGAQARDEGWEVGAHLLYQDARDISFTGGSTASFDEDFGLAVAFGYRFNPRLEVQFGLDWNKIDYDVDLASASVPGLRFAGQGDLESFTPHVNANFNFLEGSLTPYVSAGVGWSFIDTNIPDAPPQNVCWWDPWFGEVCDSYQSTHTTDSLMYQMGGGVRWDVSPGYTLRLGYEKRWIELDESTNTPDFDQFNLGLTFRY